MKVSSIAIILAGLLVGTVMPLVYNKTAVIVAFCIIVAYGLFISFSSGSIAVFRKSWFSTSHEIDNFMSVGSKVKTNRYLTLFPLAAIGGLVAHFLWSTL
jgi:hypothetical protein